MMGALLLKEILQTVREWRALGLVLLTPFLFSWLASWLLTRAVQTEELASLPRFRLVTSADTLPSLLEQRFLIEKVSDPRREVENGTGDLGLVTRGDTLEVLFRQDRPRSLDALQFLQTLVENLKDQDLQAFLERAGYHPPYTLVPVAVGPSPPGEGNPWKRQIQRFATRFIVYLAMVFLLMASMQIATDLSIGEKERGTMEAFLASGVSRWGIVVSKTLVATLAGMIAAGIVLFNLRGLHLGAAPPPGPLKLLTVWMFLLPAGLVSALSFLLVGSLASSIKEAQALNGLVLTVYFGAVSLSALPFTLPFMEVLPVGSLTHYLNLYLAGFPVGSALGLSVGLHLVWAGGLFFLVVAIYRRGWLWLR